MQPYQTTNEQGGNEIGSIPPVKTKKSHPASKIFIIIVLTLAAAAGYFLSNPLGIAAAVAAIAFSTTIIHKLNKKSPVLLYVILIAVNIVVGVLDGLAFIARPSFFTGIVGGYTLKGTSSDFYAETCLHGQVVAYIDIEKSSGRVLSYTCGSAPKCDDGMEYHSSVTADPTTWSYLECIQYFIDPSTGQREEMIQADKPVL
jgi:hypothetical protein